MDLLRQILTELPKFHTGETEIRRAFTAAESYLNRQEVEALNKKTPACYGISAEVAKFIYDSVDEGFKTLETGAGISTLVFALKKTEHIAVTPNEDEVLAIKEYAKSKDISLNSVEFVIDTSERFLPKLTTDKLDLVFIDGKHAFPWPIIDWFYTADRLKERGFMVVDDVELYGVALLRDFLCKDKRWKLYKSFAGHTCVFQKIHSSIHDVAWHMQPQILGGLKDSSKKSILRNIFNRLVKLI